MTTTSQETPSEVIYRVLRNDIRSPKGSGISVYGGRGGDIPIVRHTTNPILVKSDKGEPTGSTLASDLKSSDKVQDMIKKSKELSHSYKKQKGGGILDMFESLF
jgi:hypothetical protein